MKKNQHLRLFGGVRPPLLLLMLGLILFVYTSPSQGALPPLQDDDPQLPRNPKLDSYLADVAATAEVSTADALSVAESGLLRLSGDRVQVQVVTHPPGMEVAREAIAEAGGEVTSAGYDAPAVSSGVPYYLRVQTEDQVGNQAEWTTLFTLLYDNQPPLISDLTPANGSVTTDAWTPISATLSDPVPGSGVQPVSTTLILDSQVVTPQVNTAEGFACTTAFPGLWAGGGYAHRHQPLRRGLQGGCR